MKFKKPLKITSRTSSVTNGFVQAIIPSVEPSEDEVVEALSILGIDRGDMTCAYCGQPSTDWDHLRPLVRNKRPTGYVNELRNLVPSCGPCNQSKSGRDWREWITGDAQGSPKSRAIPDLERRVARLQRYEAWGAVEPLPLRDLAGSQAWDQHWKNLADIEERMYQAQHHADLLKQKIKNSLSDNRAKTL